ncbi:MAG: aldehyde dehydrogenase [Haloferacaceae archaeon]
MDVDLPGTGVYVDGEHRAGVERFPVLDPATNEELTTVAEAGAPGVDAAVASSERALAEWRDVDAGERREHLLALADAVREHSEWLARLETTEVGRPISQSRALVTGAARYFEYYAGLTDKVEGETIPVPGDYLDYTVREPLGVTGHLVPWNVSLKLGARSFAPALATGNTLVVKPAPEAPLSLLAFAELASEAGLPDGVLNVVPGDGPRTGAALTHDGRVRGLVFTGSRETGELVAKAAAEHVIPVALELGGKSPNVVFPDADLDRAAGDTLKAFMNAGQVCHAGTRVFVHDDVYDAFVADLVERTEAMEVGPGETDPDVGPLVTAEARDRVADAVDAAVADGARLLAGGHVPREGGNYYAPTLLDGVDDDAAISCEELFGPVLTLYRFGSEAEVIERANDTRYGLSAVVWTNDLSRAHRVAGAIEAGSVAVNEYPATFVEAPFGGYKESGLGREKGQQAIEHYTQLKNVAVRIDRPGEQ